MLADNNTLVATLRETFEWMRLPTSEHPGAGVSHRSLSRLAQTDRAQLGQTDHVFGVSIHKQLGKLSTAY